MNSKLFILFGFVLLASFSSIFAESNQQQEIIEMHWICFSLFCSIL